MFAVPGRPGGSSNIYTAGRIICKLLVPAQIRVFGNDYGERVNGRPHVSIRPADGSRDGLAEFKVAELHLSVPGAAEVKGEQHHSKGRVRRCRAHLFFAGVKLVFACFCRSGITKTKPVWCSQIFCDAYLGESPYSVAFANWNFEF